MCVPSLSFLSHEPSLLFYLYTVTYFHPFLLFHLGVLMKCLKDNFMCISMPKKLKWISCEAFNAILTLPGFYIISCQEGRVGAGSQTRGGVGYGIMLSIWKHLKPDYWRWVPGLSMPPCCSLLPAVAVPAGVPAFEIERTHASHLLPTSLWMGQGQANVTGGVHLSGNQISEVLAGAEGNCDLIFPTQSLPNSTWKADNPSERSVTAGRNPGIWCEGSESEWGCLSAETKGHIAGHQHVTESLCCSFWQMNNQLSHSPKHLKIPDLLSWERKNRRLLHFL